RRQRRHGPLDPGRRRGAGMEQLKCGGWRERPVFLYTAYGLLHTADRTEVTTMRRGIGRWRILANAGFALAVLALGGFGLYQVAGRHWKVQPTFRVRAEF